MSCWIWIRSIGVSGRMPGDWAATLLVPARLAAVSTPVTIRLRMMRMCPVLALSGSTGLGRRRLPHVARRSPDGRHELPALEAPAGLGLRVDVVEAAAGED